MERNRIYPYAFGRNALELTRLAVHQQFALVGGTTDTDQRPARNAIETDFDAIEAVTEGTERAATESIAATSKTAAGLTDTPAATVESTFDVFLDTAAPLGHPPARRPERRPTA